MERGGLAPLAPPPPPTRTGEVGETCTCMGTLLVGVSVTCPFRSGPQTKEYGYIDLETAWFMFNQQFACRPIHRITFGGIDESKTLDQ